jgi:hypothetical protein
MATTAVLVHFPQTFWLSFYESNLLSPDSTQNVATGASKAGYSTKRGYSTNRSLEPLRVTVTDGARISGVPLILVAQDEL